ncbi:Cytokine receptor [Formica fusca]
MPNKMNQCLSYGPDIASRRVGCRCASNISSMSRLPFPVGDFVMYNDNCVAPRTDSVVLSEKEETITTTSENETNNAARLSQNTLPSHSACPADQCSSEENDRPTCNCNCIINHRNQNHIQKKSARRYLYLCISSTMKCYFNKIFRLSIAQRRDHSWGIRWIFIVLSCLFLIVNAANECAIGIETPGWTVPRGDIIIKYGNPLRIMCMLNETYVNKHFPGKNSSNLIFFRNDKRMEQEYITVINRTTIMLYNELPPPGDNMYYCQLNLSGKDVGVCLNKVVIGYEPKAPSNFTCISYNWENITCTWDTQKNFIQTTHELMFKFNGGRRGARRFYPCPVEYTKKNSCSWTQYSSPMYRQTYENYTFVMYVHNQFGNVTDIHKIDHFAQVIPAKPMSLSVINKTSNSATLHWELPFPLQNFPPGVIHKVMYQNQWDHKKDWKVIIIDTEPRLNRRYFNLTGLEYANTVYDVRVFLRSAKATGENMYSEPGVVTFRTLPTLPSFSPRTDIGSFEIVENNGNRDIYLYWQMIPQYLENGDNFKYQVNYVEENGHKITLEPIETTKTYAKFKGLTFNNYRFKIASMNKVGINKNYTEIVIPSRDEMPHEPIAFTKMAFEGGLYELSWKPPIMHKNIANYTIFWCDNERDRPYQCTGYLNWTHVSMNTTVYNITVPDPDKVYQFAISANTNKGSSGMVWSSCTVIHTKVLGKMKSVWINRIGSDFIEVGWKLDCSDRIGIVEGFKIYYCPIVSPLDTKCKGPKLNVTIKSYPPMISGIVKHLTPYTTYMLGVTTVTKNGESQPSEPLYNTTLEAAPSTSPLNVKAINITNTTMFITWQSPQAMNGVLRYYEVHYNDFMKKVEEGNSTRLTGLLAYTEYNISVTACTVACSEKSLMIKQRTKIGIPDKIGVPKVRFMNSSQVIVTWHLPQYPAGPIAYYEIENSSGEIHNVTKLEAQLSIPDCKTTDQEGLNKFRVRAINIGSNNERLTGPWSETGEGNCYSNGISQATAISLWVIGVILLVAVTACCGCGAKRLWLKYQDMQDIEVKLPPGLTSNMTLLRKDGGPHIRQPSADSSGCSSGQESVTSSLTTTEFQISSDSGTEVDPVPTSPDKLLETLSNWESNSASLRQRSVSRGPETTSRCRESYVPVKTGDANLNEILSLARSTPNLADSTGNTMTPQTWPSTGYISMLSSEDLSGNPSPTSRGNTVINATGCYSVVGIRRIRMPVQSEEDGDDGIDNAGTVHDTLISNKQGTKLMHNLYLPLVMGKKEMSSKANAFNLDKLGTFIESDKSEEDALMSHLTTSDKTMTSKPFFQPTLIDTMHKPLALPSSIEQPEKSNISSSFASTSFPDSSNEPFVSSFVSPTLPVSSISLTDTASTSTLTSTNPHVSDQRSALSETSRFLVSRPKENNEETLKMSHASHNSTPSESSSESSVSSMHQMLQQQQENMEFPSINIMEEIQEMEVEEDSTPTVRLNSHIIQPILIKHKENSDYVIIADPSTIHQKTAINQSDEQYSKVTVVPSSTMQ